MHHTATLSLVIAAAVLSSCYSLHSNHHVELDDASAAADTNTSDTRLATGAETGACPTFPAPDFSVSEASNIFAIGAITESVSGCAASRGMHFEDRFEVHSNWDGVHVRGAVLHLPDGHTLNGSDWLGSVEFCSVTEYEGADGCRWSRYERMSGLTTLRYTSSEVVVLGESCTPPCSVSWNSL
ncbi:MAG: hypothetical protein IPK60_11730 [Sandaracinaceae bacterium]|nr:hypothetical protein [Sandaracinaceae bacterium]